MLRESRYTFSSFYFVLLVFFFRAHFPGHFSVQLSIVYFVYRSFLLSILLLFIPLFFSQIRVTRIGTDDSKRQSRISNAIIGVKYSRHVLKDQDKKA